MTPTILEIPGGRHPKAQILSVDAEAGTIGFRWLLADETPVTNGQSGTMFTPSYTEAGGVRTYNEPTEEEMIASIASE